MIAEHAIIEVGPGETRVALFDGARVVEIWIEPDAAPDPRGAVVLGRVRAHRPELAGAFIDIGDPAGDAFWPRTGRTPLPPAGAAAVVQVRRAAAGGKGPRVGGQITLARDGVSLRAGADGVAITRAIGGPARRRDLRAALAPLTPDGAGWWVDRAGGDLEPGALNAIAAALADQWRLVRDAAKDARPPRVLVPAPDLAARLAMGLPADRIRHDADLHLFADSGAEAALAAALEPRIDLVGGGRLTIEATTALTAVDVDAAGAGPDMDAAMINRAAAAELAAALRLRALGGIVAVDFLRLTEAAARKALTEQLRTTLATDPGQPEAIGFTRTGLFEIVRPRLGPSLAECMAAPSARAHSWLRALLRASGGQNGPILHCDPALIAYFEEPTGAAARTVVERRLGEVITLAPAAWPAVTWRHGSPVVGGARR